MSKIEYNNNFNWEEHFLNISKYTKLTTSFDEIRNYIENNYDDDKFSLELNFNESCSKEEQHEISKKVSIIWAEYKVTKKFNDIFSNNFSLK